MILREGRSGALNYSAKEPNNWVEQEAGDCEFEDVRLGRRLVSLLGQIGGSVGESIPVACQDWANAKAAYRFFSNERVNERDILAGHFRATHDRFSANDSVVLVLHDTTEFSFQRQRTEAIGITHKVSSWRKHRGRPRNHTICGILMHSSLAVTTEGLPLGLCAVKFWSRKKFKGCDALKRKINPTRVPIEKKESIRWIRKSEAFDGNSGRPRPLRPHWRPRERHLRTILRGKGDRHAFPLQNLRRSLSGRWKSHCGR